MSSTSSTAYNKAAMLGFLVTLIGSILFSTKAIVVKLAFAHTTIDALTLLTLRMIFSLPFYLAAAWIGSTKTGQPKFTVRQWMIILFLGLFGYYLSSLFDFIGLQYISAGLERLILFLYPTFVVFINLFFFKEKISRLQVGALALTYVGIAIAYIGELTFERENAELYWGSFLIFLCAITFSVYIAGSGRMVKQVGPTKFTAYAMLASTLGVFVHFAIAGNYSHLAEVSGFWGYGLFLGVVATVIPTFLLSFGMKRIGSNNVAIITAIGPVSTIIQANLVLGERIFMAQLVGTIFVVVGVLLIGWKSRKNLGASA